MSVCVCIYIYIKDGGFPGDSVVKNPPAIQETRVPSLGRDNLLEKEMTINSSILAGKFQGQRSLAGYNPWGCKEPDMAEQLNIQVFAFASPLKLFWSG